VAFRFNLIPRDEQFFDLFSQMADEIRRAAADLETMLAANPPDVAMSDRIRDAEHRCDTLTHDAIQRLHRTFITPFDREDLYALSSALDNVMDAIDHAASLVRLYRIRELPDGARALAHIVSAASASLQAALEAMATQRPFQPHAVEVNRLENDADRVYQTAVQALFDNGTDPVQIMKSKDLLDVLEEIPDAAEDVANVIESIVVKHS
jgi:uncharacterized protein